MKEFLKSVDIEVIGKKVDRLTRYVRRALSCWKIKNSLEI